MLRGINMLLNKLKKSPLGGIVLLIFVLASNLFYFKTNSRTKKYISINNNRLK